MSRNSNLNARGTRARKFQLSQRDGQHCAYCFRRFATLREATLDHVAPLSLLRTWSASHLVLACRPCNTRKDDRLPLSLALLLCAYADRSRLATELDTVDAVNTRTTWGVHETWAAPVRPPHGPCGRARGRRDPHTPHAPCGQRADDPSTLSTGPIGYAGWLALARIAAASESAARSMPDPRESTSLVGCIHPTGQGDRPGGSTVNAEPPTVNGHGCGVNAGRSGESTPAPTVAHPPTPLPARNDARTYGSIEGEVAA